MPCVLRDWVIEQPLAIQGTLVTGIRGPDGAPKYCPAKELVQAYRWTVMNNAHAKEHAGSFMGDWTGIPSDEALRAFLKDHDSYSHHWMMHFIHCAEIVGYLHPDNMIRAWWSLFYESMCDAFHMGIETKDQMMRRLASRT